nr:SURF1 family protein [Roseateles koreensis]
MLLAVLLCAGFTALGLWQLQRLSWKESLLQRISAGQSGPVLALPAAPAAPTVDLEYRRVRVRGQFDHARETLVRASTALGSGYWVITPLQTEGGAWVLVNRGFVPAEFATPASRPGTAPLGLHEWVGLLRLSEPGGSLLQHNDPVARRWYSRDVAAIASAQGLPGAEVAPFFVDALAAADASQTAPWPRAGLTVLQFNNNHRAYAWTWFALALMVAAGAVFLLRTEWRLTDSPPA